MHEMVDMLALVCNGPSAQHAPLHPPTVLAPSGHGLSESQAGACLLLSARIPTHPTPSIPPHPRLQAMDEMIDKLVFVSKDNLTYIAEFERYARCAARRLRG